MKIAVYLGHPAQYHFFKHPIKMWETSGHCVQVVIRKKDILEELLLHDGIPYVNILPEGRGCGLLATGYALLKRIVRLYGAMRPFQPDILIGSDASLPIVARLLHTKSIITIEDDYSVIKPLARIAYPLTHVILAPFVCQVGRWERKKVGYNGYMKLSALHPSRFSIDRHFVASKVGNEPYCLIRLSALNAYHDKGINGLSLELVHRVISVCTRFGVKVWVNAELSLYPSLLSYQLHIHPAHLHQMLAGATLLISDSQSMSVEAAVLGVPSIRFSDFVGRISVLEELEHKYQLTKGISTHSPELLLQQLEDWLSTDALHELFQRRKDRMVIDKIDVAWFIAWFVEDYGCNHSFAEAINRFQAVCSTHLSAASSQTDDCI